MRVKKQEIKRERKETNANGAKNKEKNKGSDSIKTREQCF
jgi:hypothetical protein